MVAETKRSRSITNDLLSKVCIPKPEAILKVVDDMEGRKEMFYLTTHSTHFIYGYMESDIW